MESGFGALEGGSRGMSRISAVENFSLPFPYHCSLVAVAAGDETEGSDFFAPRDQEASSMSVAIIGLVGRHAVFLSGCLHR